MPGNDNAPAEEEVDTLESQALIVTCGPHKDRICENDDDEFMFKSDFSVRDIRWMEKNNIIWKSVAEKGETDNDWLGVDCEVVTFGFYLSSRGHYSIPRQFLKPATTRDLIIRSQQIAEIVGSDAFAQERKYSDQEISILLKEKNYIVNELWRRERNAVTSSTPRDVFLCHASVDKPFVRQVLSDLSNAGHNPWIDEFEIRVGDSIVQKITEGTAKAGYLVLFLSSASTSSDWVKREWSSSLARQLSGRDIKLLPALIENCEIPAILSDIKYADFRNSYNDGLSELLTSLR